MKSPVWCSPTFKKFYKFNSHMRGIRSSKNSAVFGGASSKKEIHHGNQCALDLADKSLKC